MDYLESRIASDFLCMLLYEMASYLSTSNRFKNIFQSPN